MKKFILLFVALQLLSCDSRYDGDIRLQFTGKVIDENNNPIQNQQITISAENESSDYNSNNVGFGKTDSNGNYSILIPAATRLNTYSLEINNEFDANNNNQLVNIRYYNIKNSNFSNYKIQLPISKLYLQSSLSNLEVTFNQTNANNAIQNVEYIGEIANEYIDFNPEFTENTNFKRVRKNQTIEIKYQVKNTSTGGITTNSSFITIDNSDIILHTINY